MTTCILKLGDRVTCHTLGRKQTGTIDAIALDGDRDGAWIRLETLHSGGRIHMPISALTRVVEKKRRAR